MHKNQKYKLYPNKEQKEILNGWFGCSRKVWNLMLESNIKKYEAEGEFLLGYSMNYLLPELKKEHTFLKTCPSQILQQKCQDLKTALGMKIDKIHGFPKFKSRRRDNSGIRLPQGWEITEDGKLSLPKMKTDMKIKLHRKIDGKATGITIKRDSVGDYYAVITYAVDDISQIPVITHVVGIDVGLKEFAMTSEAEVISNPKYYVKNQKKLSKAQRDHSRKQKGSNNKEKSRALLARKHRKITRMRENFIKQIASSITKNCDLICVEDLNISGMLKNRKLAKAISDVGWGQFLSELEWQCKKRGKLLVKINRFFASSKTCSCCGHKKDMPLDKRTYVCDNCNLEIDRDLNAAINIMNEGFRIYTAGTAEINAFGDMSQSTDSAKEAASL